MVEHCVDASKVVESRVLYKSTSSLYDVGKYYYPLRYDLRYTKLIYITSGD